MVLYDVKNRGSEAPALPEWMCEESTGVSILFVSKIIDILLKINFIPDFDYGC